MTALLLDGKLRAAEILEELKTKIAALSRPPRLCAMLVGEDPASEIFLKEKERAARAVGIAFELLRVPATVSQTALSKKLNARVHQSNLDGIILQLPLPDALDRNRHGILRIIPEDKDVDCISEQWLGRMQSGRMTLKLKHGEAMVIPPVAGAVKELLEMSGASIRGSRAVVIGWGDLVGKPCAAWLLQEGALVTVVQEGAQDFAKILSESDIVISGTGKAALIHGSMIKRGAIVIDAGWALKDGKSCGDVDMESVKEKASYVSPVPGGVGPLTVAVLLRNVVSVAQARSGLSSSPFRA